MAKKQVYQASESNEQRALFEWARLQRGELAELCLMYHVPNEGKRSAATAARMYAEGLRAGVPDICLPVARGAYHGLYIELKRADGGRLSIAQKTWLADLRWQGYCARVCNGWTDAALLITQYMQLTDGERIGGDV